MASLNKVTLIGRLTREPEVRVFANGGKVAKLGFVVSAGRKKGDDGQWEDEPCFLDVDIFNRGEKGKMADLAEQYLSKGKQVCIVGKLKMDLWTDREGQKRNKIKVEADEIVFIEPKDRHDDPPQQESPPAQEQAEPLFAAPKQEELPF